MQALTRGLRIDRASWDKGVSDGMRGLVWWPGAGIEPLSYAAGYTDGQAKAATMAGASRVDPRLPGRAA